MEDPEAVTFTSTSDADKVVDAIRSMVEDYNAMVTEIKNAYSTLPAQKSSGAYYEPLTDKDMEGMSESAIAAYEEKAKQGLLFGDSDLSALYSRLVNAVSMTGSDGAALKAAGITTAYSNGLTTLTLDETTLRATLETDPDKVRDIFTKSTESGASTNGLMQALKTPLDLYGKTTAARESWWRRQVPRWPAARSIPIQFRRSWMRWISKFRSGRTKCPTRLTAIPQSFQRWSSWSAK